MTYLDARDEIERLKNLVAIQYRVNEEMTKELEAAEQESERLRAERDASRRWSWRWRKLAQFRGWPASKHERTRQENERLRAEADGERARRRELEAVGREESKDRARLSDQLAEARAYLMDLKVRACEPCPHAEETERLRAYETEAREIRAEFGWKRDGRGLLECIRERMAQPEAAPEHHCGKQPGACEAYCEPEAAPFGTCADWPCGHPRVHPQDEYCRECRR